MQPCQGEGGCYAGQDRPRVSQHWRRPARPGALAGRDDRGEHITAVGVIGLGVAMVVQIPAEPGTAGMGGGVTFVIRSR